MHSKYHLPLRVLVYAKKQLSAGIERTVVARKILHEMERAHAANPALHLPILSQGEYERYFLIYDQVDIAWIDARLREEQQRRKAAAAQRAYYREYQRKRRAEPAYRDYQNMQRRTRRQTLKHASPEVYAEMKAKERARMKRWREANPEKYRKNNAENRKKYRNARLADPATGEAFREKERVRAKDYRARKRNQL